MPEPFYPSDLTDSEWQIIDSMLPLEKQCGKQRQVDFRQVVNAIFYRADNGIKWLAMPINFPAWQTVYGYYRVLGQTKSKVESHLGKQKAFMSSRCDGS